MSVTADDEEDVEMMKAGINDGALIKTRNALS